MDRQVAVSAFSKRTDGDGMESLECGPRAGGDCSSGEEVLTESRLAERVITVASKLSTPMTKGGSPQCSKEAKFVPYEPYKGAVKPIIPVVRKKKSQVQGKTPADKTDGGSNCSPSIAASDQELCNQLLKLRKENEDLHLQLKQCTQVNSELKKLLVASVGEDMEARVHFLTEDKAKLCEDIRRYVETIACDFEEKEKLAIESDIWRSKFLASSVVIDELSKSKSQLQLQNADLGHCLRGLLDEVNSIQRMQQDMFRRVKALNSAFDPLNRLAASRTDLARYDVISTGAINLKLVDSLSERLLGSRCNQVLLSTAPDANEAKQQLTNAQLAAQQALMQQSETWAHTSLSQVSADRVSQLARRTLNQSHFSCCTHCVGQMQIV